MADPLSIAGLVLTIGDTINKMLKVAADARNAPDDIKALQGEIVQALFVLDGSLRHLQGQPQPGQFSSKQLVQMLQSAKETLDSLNQDLDDPKTWLARSTQRLAWHWTKDVVAKHVARVERIKMWFLMALTTDNAANDREILRQMEALSLAIKQDQESRATKLAHAKQQKLLQYLAPVSSELVHMKALSLHHPGTSTWFTAGPLRRFLENDDKRGAIFWLKGRSGSGKTTLLAHVIEQLKNDPCASAVLSFYCSFDGSTPQDPLRVMGSLLAQLSHKVSAVFEYLMPELEKSEQQAREVSFSAWDLEETFIKLAATVPPTFVVLDAINESDMKAGLESLILRLAAKCPGLRIIVSSTTDRTHKGDTTVLIIDEEMAVDKVEGDIKIYVDHRLSDDETLLLLSERLKQEIRDVVLRGSAGVFRYAQCQMDHLAAQRTGRGVRKALSDMPSDLNEIYERALKNIRNDEDKRLMARTLSWLAYARRPLRLEELADAVVMEEGEDDLDDDKRLHDPKVLIEIGKGLVDFDAATHVVSLSHSSIKRFLTSDWIRNSSVADYALPDELLSHHTIMRVCISYLSFSAFNGGFGTLGEETLDAYPLLDYASWHWPDHLQEPYGSEWDLISAFLSTRSSQRGGNYGFWINILAGTVDLPAKIVEQTHPLYYVASFGFTELVKALLRFDDSVDLEAPAGRAGSTALRVACFRRQKNIARILIEAGANPLSRDSRGLNALWWANSNRWTDIVDLIKTKTVYSEEDLEPAMPLSFADEVQTAALVHMKDSTDKSLGMGREEGFKPTTISISTYHLQRSDLESFLLQRFGGGNYSVDQADDSYIVMIYRPLVENDLEEMDDFMQEIEIIRRDLRRERRDRT